MRSNIKSVLGLIFGLAFSCGVHVADFPTQTVRLIVPFPPGGNVDAVTRVIAPNFQEALGGNVIVENRGGASGMIGSKAVAGAPADGHMLLMVGSNHGINPVTFKELPYDTLNDFSPVGLIGTMPLILVVSPEVPVNSVDELKQFSRDNPEGLRFGITPGSTTHLATQMLVSDAELNAIQVPYKGDGPTVVDLLGGHVNAYIGLVSVIEKYITADRVRAIGVASKQRLPSLPELPTLHEQGLENFEAASWNGLFAPAGTPPAVIEKMNQALSTALADPKVRNSLEGLGLTISAGGPEAADEFLREQIKRWGTVVETAGIPKM